MVSQSGHSSERSPVEVNEGLPSEGDLEQQRQETEEGYSFLTEGALAQRALTVYSQLHTYGNIGEKYFDQQLF